MNISESKTKTLSFLEAAVIRIYYETLRAAELSGKGKIAFEYEKVDHGLMNITVQQGGIIFKVQLHEDVDDWVPAVNPGGCVSDNLFRKPELIVPGEEIEVVFHACKTFIAWPRKKLVRLVRTNTTEDRWYGKSGNTREYEGIYNHLFYLA